jgi:2-aminoadipate transaminase
MQTPWEYRYANRMKQMGSSVIRELLKLTEQPDIISFAGGLPAPEVFPIKEFQAACNYVLENQGPQALQYSITEGYRPLREMLAERTARFASVSVTPENILITSGSQQALDFIGRIFINPGDHIVVENPTYLGALQAWNAYGAQYITVPSDENGMVTDELEKALRVGPKFIYVLPNFQNPSGTTLSLERRQQLVELADRYGVPIVEDDPYGQLRFEGESLPSVVSLDSEYRGDDGCYTGNVIYLSTFSKLLAPGIRLAWVIAPEQVIHKLVQTKQAADLNTSAFNQMTAYEVGKDGFLDEHVKHIRAVYKERRDVMLEMMEEMFPREVHWTHPQGGMFLWGILPEELDAAKVLKLAVQRKVAFVPGDSFHSNGGGKNTMRLNFSYSNPENIREGITRLGAVLKEQVRKPA